MKIKNLAVLRRSLSNPFILAKIALHRYLHLGIKNHDRTFRSFYGWNFGKAGRIQIWNYLTDNSISIKPAQVEIYEDSSHSLTLAEITILAILIKSINPKKVLEIGTGTGYSSKVMNDNGSKEMLIYTMDLPVETTSYSSLLGDIKPIYWNKDIQSMKLSQDRLGAISRINKLSLDSWKFSEKIAPLKFDFVFIDGCHDFKYVKNDTQESLKVMTENGFILWHDYGMLPEVSKYIDRLIKLGAKIKIIEGTRFAIGTNDSNLARAVEKEI